MLNFLFRGLLTFNATSLLVIIYLVQKGITLDKIFLFKDLKLLEYFTNVPNLLSYCVYVIFTIILTGLSIFLSSKLGSDKFKSGEIINIEYANNSFLPSYLGYFFVALSINNNETLIFVYIVLFIFTFMSQALYFNPLFLIFRYNFYNVTSKSGVSFFLISRQNFRKPQDVELVVNRINDYTFIEGIRHGLCHRKNKEIDK